MMAKIVFTCVSLLLFNLNANAEFIKIYYAPLRGEFVVVQSKIHASLTSVKDPIDVSVFIGPAHRVMEQPVANRKRLGGSNLRVYLTSGPMLLLKTDPFGITSRYHYDDPERDRFASSSWGDGPHEELIELENDEFDLSHRLTLIPLETYKQPDANAQSPTVMSILNCNKLIDKPPGQRF